MRDDTCNSCNGKGQWWAERYGVWETCLVCLGTGKISWIDFIMGRKALFNGCLCSPHKPSEEEILEHSIHSGKHLFTAEEIENYKRMGKINEKTYTRNKRSNKQNRNI